MQISQKDVDYLLEMMKTDPSFVKDYLGSENPTFTVSQCSKALGISHNTVLYRIKNGSLIGERNSKGDWQIKARDLQDHITMGGIQKRFSTKQKEKDDEMKTESYLYDKSSMQNVLDFLHNWEKSNTVAFSTKTLIRSFNKVCATKTSESQMSNILSNLTRKKILVRKGRGIYSLQEGFVAIPKIEQTESSGAVLVQETTNSAWEQMKHKERHLVDEFLAKHSVPNEDFVFSISDIVKEYPHEDKAKIAKAVQNMKSSKRLDKGRNLGEYIQRATDKISTRPIAKIEQSDLGSKLEEILKLNISDELKAKVIKELMN